MTALYALEDRLKSYNKYPEWEVKKYPLTHLPWPLAEFVQDYTSVLKTRRY